MSRVGKQLVIIPEGVQVDVSGQRVRISGPLGTLEREVRPEIAITVGEKQVTLKPQSSNSKATAYWGLERSLIANMVEGVTAGYRRELELVGLGYRVSKTGGGISLAVGFSHPVEITAPEGVTLEVEGNNRIKVSGIDKALVGQVAAKIRAARPPEPYKGKGIKYAGEVVRRKAGKAGKVGMTGG
ncbi:50S ribosomal protein L6 [Candidatus Parcubacteria bacterium]|nr:50S ribosomal protein L6 [Candidatus Parcubacteria bacterium]